MEPDRLAELHRQRAIVRDHLAWLENEIAATTGAPVSAPPAPSSAPISSVDPAEPAPNPASAAAAARRGCFVSAAVLLFAGLIALAVIYFVRYRDRPLLFASPDRAAAPAR